MSILPTNKICESCEGRGYTYSYENVFGLKIYKQTPKIEKCKYCGGSGKAI